MRKKTKQGGRKLNLYLSERARGWLASEAERQEVSQSQIVEQLVLAKGKVLSPQNFAIAAPTDLASDSTAPLKVAEDSPGYVTNTPATPDTPPPSPPPLDSSQEQRSARPSARRSRRR